jgi:hypothetical protein
MEYFTEWIHIKTGVPRTPTFFNQNGEWIPKNPWEYEDRLRCRTVMKEVQFWERVEESYIVWIKMWNWISNKPYKWIPAKGEEKLGKEEMIDRRITRLIKLLYQYKVTLESHPVTAYTKQIPDYGTWWADMKATDKINLVSKNLGKETLSLVLRRFSWFMIVAVTWICWQNMVDHKLFGSMISRIYTGSYTLEGYKQDFR